MNSTVLLSAAEAMTISGGYSNNSFDEWFDGGFFHFAPSLPNPVITPVFPPREPGTYPVIAS